MTAPTRKGFRNLLNGDPRYSFRWAWAHLYERYRERQLGVDTAGWREWENRLDDEESCVYEPAWYACLDSAFQQLEIRPGVDVFLDYGSGKGRALVVAATHPFRQVIGIESQNNLNALARENIARARSKLACPTIDILSVDARQYRVPADVTVIFMYNPFRGDILDKVLEQIRRSLALTPRTIRLLYLFPHSEGDPLATCDWLRLDDEIPTGHWDWVRFRVYESRTPPSGTAAT